MDQNLKSNKLGFLLLMSKGEGNLLWEDEEFNKKKMLLILKQLKFVGMGEL